MPEKSTERKISVQDLEALHPHRSLNMVRLLDDPQGFELELAKLWANWCHGQRHINDGIGALDLICSEPVMPSQFGKKGIRPLVELDDTHRAVAATVVQWMGSNVGRSFLVEAFRNAGWNLRLDKIETPEGKTVPKGPDLARP